MEFLITQHPVLRIASMTLSGSETSISGSVGTAEGMAMTYGQANVLYTVLVFGFNGVVRRKLRTSKWSSRSLITVRLDR